MIPMMTEHDSQIGEQAMSPDVATFRKKDWVCLVSSTDLEHHRSFRDHRSGAGTLLSTALWRQIELVAMPRGVTILLGSVNEAAALGGPAPVSHGARTVTLSWDDLDDLDGLTRHFENEQVGVLRRAREMLIGMRERIAPMRLTLAA
jgi:hypothetical protein